MEPSGSKYRDMQGHAQTASGGVRHGYSVPSSPFLRQRGIGEPSLGDWQSLWREDRALSVFVFVVKAHSFPFNTI